LPALHFFKPARSSTQLLLKLTDLLACALQSLTVWLCFTVLFVTFWCGAFEAFGLGAFRFRALAAGP
jgi:hypothetical protein